MSLDKRVGDSRFAPYADGNQPQLRNLQSPAIPVIVTPVLARTMPVRLQAIGNVEVQTSVAVKSRVDGQIVKVFFTDGQVEAIALRAPSDFTSSPWTRSSPVPEVVAGPVHR